MSEEDGTANIASDVIPDPDEFGEVGEFGQDVVEDDPDLIEESDDSGEPDFSEGEELEDEESSEEGHSPESKSYKEMQSWNSKTQNKNSELEGNLQQIEDRLAPLGGLEKVVQAFSYMQNDPDFRALAAKKSGRPDPSAVDESNMSDEAREALEMVRKTVRAELNPMLDKLKREQIEPLTDRVRQGDLNSIADDLLENYGEQFQEQLPTIERLAKGLPQESLDNPSYKIMESLFHDSLREDGRAESYYLSGYQNKVQGKKGKVTGSPQNRGVNESMPKFKKPKTMFDAARIADKKASYASRRKR